VIRCILIEHQFKFHYKKKLFLKKKNCNKILQPDDDFFLFELTWFSEREENTRRDGKIGLNQWRGIGGNDRDIGGHRRLGVVFQRSCVWEETNIVSDKCECGLEAQYTIREKEL